MHLFNRRLSLYGFETLGTLVGDFLAGKFPVITEDRQIQSLDSNLQDAGMKTVLNGQFEPTFYKNIDLDDMLNYLLNIRKFQNHNARSLVNHFRRFRDMFFGPDPVEILKLTPHKKSWILQAMRHFGNYYNYKTNNPECKELIEKIINRYGLNIGLDMHQKIYIVDDNYVLNSVKKLVTIPGEIGLTAGYAIKKVMKIAAVIVGLFVAGLAYLSYKGWIDVKWLEMENATMTTLSSAEGHVVDALNNTASQFATYSSTIATSGFPIASRFRICTWTSDWIQEGVKG